MEGLKETSAELRSILPGIVGACWSVRVIGGGGGEGGDPLECEGDKEG